MHSIKVLNQPTTLQKFSKVDSRFFSESVPKKIFETSRTTLKNFFEDVFMNYFQILYLGKRLKRPNGFYEFFSNVYS